VLVRAQGHHRPYEPDLPGGAVDEGEAELTAAIREIKEETGIEVGAMQMRLDYAKTYLYEGRHVSATKLLYTCRVDGILEVNLDVREHQTYDWCPVSQLLSKYSFGEFYDEALEYMTAHGLF
jgi:8-oxo-dGTP pyrophosphatase MutT (NUDIX family)